LPAAPYINDKVNMGAKVRACDLSSYLHAANKPESPISIINNKILTNKPYDDEHSLLLGDEFLVCNPVWRDHP